MAQYLFMNKQRQDVRIVRYMWLGAFFLIYEQTVPYSYDSALYCRFRCFPLLPTGCLSCFDTAVCGLAHLSWKLATCVDWCSSPFCLLIAIIYFDIALINQKLLFAKNNTKQLIFTCYTCQIIAKIYFGIEGNNHFIRFMIYSIIEQFIVTL